MSWCGCSSNMATFSLMQDAEDVIYDDIANNLTGDWANDESVLFNGWIEIEMTRGLYKSMMHSPANCPAGGGQA